VPRDDPRSASSQPGTRGAKTQILLRSPPRYRRLKPRNAPTRARDCLLKVTPQLCDACFLARRVINADAVFLMSGLELSLWITWRGLTLALSELSIVLNNLRLSRLDKSTRKTVPLPFTTMFWSMWTIFREPVLILAKITTLRHRLIKIHR
jgi:hypothetical protein